jgi:hypothetical protein
MWMVSPEDLILSKLAWGRDTGSDVEARDVRVVVAIQGARLDWAYLEAWAATLGLTSALERVRS